MAFRLVRKLLWLNDRKWVHIKSIWTHLRSFNHGALAQSKCQFNSFLWYKGKTAGRFFTLIEVLVALMILISLLGLFGVTIRSTWRDQAFHAQTDKLIHQLRLAQDMLLVLRIETHLEFTPKQVSWVAVGNINRTYETVVEREHLPLTAFSDIIFEDASGEKSQGTFTLKFLDNGYLLSHGVLKLISKSGEEAFINLPGYPALFATSVEAPNLSHALHEEREFYERLTSSTLNELDVQAK